MIQRMLFVAIMFLLSLVPAIAQPGESVLGAVDGPDLLFQSTELLDITLTAPFRTIDRERDKEKEYEGTLSYLGDSGEEVVMDVNLSVRGNWRLQKDNCQYSQLWVDLRRRQTTGTVFENQNRLKLVVQCGRQNRYLNYLAKEQQLYQIFGELSEYNFDTRLVNTSYVDSENPGRSRTHLAFFIEHQNRLAERFGMEEVELNRISVSELHSAQSNLVSLFMYLAGNTDYALTQGADGDECCHNAKLLMNDAGQYIAIPYDFDGSGYVNAAYAGLPSPLTGLRSNRQRRYWGFCDSIDSINLTIEALQESRERISSIVSDSTHVSAREASRSQRYVDAFFEILDDERKVDREIVRDCR